MYEIFLLIFLVLIFINDKLKIAQAIIFLSSVIIYIFYDMNLGVNLLLLRLSYLFLIFCSTVLIITNIWSEK